MKKFVSKILTLSIAAPVVLTATTIAPCSCNSSKQLVTHTENYWTNEQAKTVHSLKEIGGKNLLYLDYTADYKLDEYIKLSPGAPGHMSRNDAFNKVLLNNQSKYKLPDPTTTTSCTAIAVKGDDNKIYMGRNMDIDNDLYDGTFSMVLKTHAHPESGSKYDTLSMAHTSWFYGMYDTVNEPSHAEALLYAPLSCSPDGINSAGLSICHLDLEWGACRQEEVESKPNLSFYFLNRLILDKCATVDEAINEVKKYSFYSNRYNSADPAGSQTNISSHWIVHDINNNSAEFFFDGLNNPGKAQLVVTKNPCWITKFNGYDKDLRCFDVNLEYDTQPRDYLWVTNFHINQMDAETRKKVVRKSEGYFRYYLAQQLLKYTPHPSFDYLKYMLMRTVYSIDLDFYMQHIIDGKDPWDPTVWTDKVVSKYSVIYNQTDKKLYIWMYENFCQMYEISL